MEISFPSSAKMKPHAFALLATLGVLTVVAVTVFVAQQSIAATKNIAIRGIARSGAGADSIPVDFTLTAPVDEKLNGEQGELRISSTTKVYENIGDTAVGGALKPVKTKRIRSQNVTAGSELTASGTYTVGDKNSVRPSVVHIHDRSFTTCGKLQGITRRSATGANEDTLTVEMTTSTVQEKRYERFFKKGSDVLFTFKDGTQFHNANGSWKTPKNRVSIQAADVTASQQATALRGKIINSNTLEVTTVDLGVNCT